MKKPTEAPRSLWEEIVALGAPIRGSFVGRQGRVATVELAAGSAIAGLEALRGRSVLIATGEQLSTAVALIELDGLARRIVLCTPDLSPSQLAAVAAIAQADAIVADASGPRLPADYGLSVYPIGRHRLAPAVERRAGQATEWILLTSATTGAPKLVVHTLASLAGALPQQAEAGARTVWSTFYDIRRYGGLQIYLRAVRSGAPLVLSAAAETVREFFERAASAGVTHISGTPSHWRRALMSGDANILRPQYVRLSGEVADQAVLDQLRAVYPAARIAHAFASTEAGVAFDVEDGRAGFPAALVEQPRDSIDLRVVGGTLRIRSSRNAARYLGDAAPLAGGDGYVDTGDLVELVDGRYYFRGRRGGVINVGGLKVHPEEVEAVLNADPRVRMSLVRARRSPITGAVVVADVVPADPAIAGAALAGEAVKGELLEACRRALPAHKVPVSLRFVASLAVTAAGKLVRPGA